MAVTIGAYSGSETVSTTEWSMTTDTAGPDSDTTDGAYQAIIDLGNLANADQFTFRVYETINAVQIVIFSQTFFNAQGTDNRGYVSPTFMLGNGWDMTLDKDAGTDRAITWSINKAA